MKTFADAEERLAESLPGYESRPQQQTLALAVETALANKSGHLLAEAGCGTGKSLGYLIPAILSGQRVVVSTATKALQDQIAGKDLPFLAEHLGKSFTYALLKGRTNYACKAKIADVTGTDVAAIAKINAESEAGTANPDFMGERDDFSVAITDQEWRKITTNSEECPGKRDCPFGDVCFAEKAKTKAKESQVVVVNHALFLTDLKVKMDTAGVGSMLDEYDAVVFDEAHEIEEYAGGIFGSQFTEAGVRNLCSEINNFVRREVPEFAEEVAALVAETSTSMVALWQVLKPGRIREANLLEAADEFINMTNALGDLAAVLMAKGFLENVPQAGLDKVRTKRNRLWNKASSMHRRFSIIVTGSFDDHVRWVETDRLRNGETRQVIKVAPVSVAEHLRNGLFATEGKQVTAVLASATLSVNGAFDYIAKRLGIDTFTGIDVGTPFDYAKQSALYIPRHLPEPTPANREAWASMAVAEMGTLVKQSDGRALLLFTSNKAMNDAYDTLASRLPYRTLKQGDMPNKALAEAFMADTHSVLFATRSFMTGVDFQGEACSLVVVDKLPFPVPTEPLTEARCEVIKRAGGSDFKEYTIPVMTLVLKQAFGRLIRHRNDTGVVAILDPRLVSKGYGSKIMASLPPAQRLTSSEQVTEFFATAGA